MGGPSWIPTFLDDLPKASAALAFAERRHSGQRRGDGTPFILHPFEVASLLYGTGAPDHVVAAGALHDVIEKAGVREATLRRRFGPRVTHLVLAVTDDDRIKGYVTRKAALRRQVAGAGDEALLLFAADKLSKLRELGRETDLDLGADGPARPMRARRLRHYQRSLAMLEERLPEESLVQQLRDELGGFLAARSAPRPA